MGEIEAPALPEADGGRPAWSAGDQAGFNTRIFVSDKSGMAGGPAGDSQRAPSASASDLGRRLLASTSATPEL